MMNMGSKKDTIRNNLIRIVTVLVMVVLLYKVVGLSLPLSIIIGYIAGLGVMLLVAYVLDKPSLEHKSK